MGKRLGLIIGVNQYQDPTFQPLQFAEHDSRALAQWLVNVQGGKWAPSDVQLVQGAHATRELAESLISQICTQIAEPGDLVMIYFAGHAFIDERSGEGYLALTNTYYQAASTTALHLPSFVQQVMARSRAGHILMLLDSLQTGPVWGRYRTTPFDAQPLLRPIVPILPGNRLILFSCRGNELAPEMGDRLGNFTHQLIVSLCGPASDPTAGNIPLRNVLTYLTSVLPEQQRPQLFGQEQSPLILVGDSMPVPFSTPPLTPQAPTPFMAAPGTPYLNDIPASPAPTGRQSITDTRYSTMTAQRDTSARIPQSAVDEHLQQQNAMMLGQAQQLLQAQNYPEAFAIVERILQVIPNDIPALLLKAQILGTAGRVPEALAIVELLQQIDAQNALVWSMRAVLLSNGGRFQEALNAVERSLEIDASNPESYGIKNSIMENMAATQLATNTPTASRITAPEPGAGRTRAFFLALLLEIAGLGLGVLGTALSILQPDLPTILSLILISLGVTIICASASRVTYRYGFLHLLPTLLISLVSGAAAIAVAIPFFLTRISFPYTARLFATLLSHPTWLPPITFLTIWLAAGAIFAPLLSIITGIAGIGPRRRR